MTYRERFINTINRKPTDRVPFSFWFHFIENEDTVDAMKNIEIMDKVYEGQKRYIETVKPDFVKVMCDGLFRYPAKALENFETVDDLNDIPAISMDNPWIRAHVAHALRVSKIREDTVYIYNVFSPSMLLRIMEGEEKFLAAFKANPEKLSEAVKCIGEGIGNLVRALMQEGGMDGIYYCVQNQNIDIISDEDHEKYFGETDRKVLDIANEINDCNILHICGYDGKRNHLEKWIDYPSKMVNWAVHVEGVSIEMGRKLFGDRTIVAGFQNTKQGILYSGSEEEIRSYTREIVQQAGKSGLIVAADCSLPFDIDWQHLIWVREELEALS